MNYNQTLEFLFSSLVSYQEKGPEAYKPGLERITAFCKHLGNPQRNYFTIHVAGTNGKGSVSHMLASSRRATARGSTPRLTCAISANGSSWTER